MAYLKSVCCPGLAIYLEKEEGVTKGREEREGKNPGGGDAGGTAIDEAIAGVFATWSSLKLPMYVLPSGQASGKI